MKSNHSWNYAGFRQYFRAKFPLTSRMSLILLFAASSSVSANDGSAVRANDVLLPSISQQANVSVKGTVKDASGEPLIGVSILVKGTTNGTVTDIDGNFNLNAPKGSVIEISYVGYVSQTVTITGSSLNIVLKEDSE